MVGVVAVSLSAVCQVQELVAAELGETAAARDGIYEDMIAAAGYIGLLDVAVSETVLFLLKFC